MSDPVPTPASSSHLQGWAQVLLALAALVGSFTGIVGLFLQDRNGGKIDAVRTEQVQQVETAEAVKAAVDKKTREERKALESNLLASWKYLESRAEDPGTPKDIEAAAIAKRAYEEFKARNGSP